MQGVSINIFVKTGVKKNSDLGRVLHCDLQGKRNEKYKFLSNNSLQSINWSKLKTKEPNYYFTLKDFSEESVYNKGFSIDDLFLIKAAGIKTHRDKVVIGFNPTELKVSVQDYLLSGINNTVEFSEKYFNPISYRPFDNRIIYYDTNLVERHRKPQMKHSLKKNVSLVVGRQTKNVENTHFFITKTLSEMKTAESSTGSYHYQLYAYPDENEQITYNETTSRTPNLNKEIISQVAKNLNLEFTDENLNRKNSFSPISLLDYIYGVLYSKNYREKFKEFLKIDFPRIPYPTDKENFWKVVNLGSQLRRLHLLEDDCVSEYITQYPKDGDNIVTRKMTKSSIGYEPSTSTLGEVWINDQQYFDNVPLVAWEFYIGGYQPAQKWLKDRNGRELSFVDILHYQKMIVALSETNRLMQEIDKIGVF